MSFHSHRFTAFWAQDTLFIGLHSSEHEQTPDVIKKHVIHYQNTRQITYDSNGNLTPSTDTHLTCIKHSRTQCCNKTVETNLAMGPIAAGQPVSGKIRRRQPASWEQCVIEASVVRVPFHTAQNFHFQWKGGILNPNLIYGSLTYPAHDWLSRFCTAYHCAQYIDLAICNICSNRPHLP